MMKLSGYAAVAQLDRVFGYEPKGRGFESLQPYQKKPSVCKAFRPSTLGSFFVRRHESGTIAGL